MLLKETLYLRSFGLFKIPVLFFVGPTVEALNETSCEVRIPLSWRTKNHLNSMYFGVLAAGADVAGGLMAMRAIEESGEKVALVFKDFHAEFLKRAEGDVIFRSDDGVALRQLVQDAIRLGERVETKVRVVATTPAVSGDEPVARFVLTISLKKKG